MTGVAWHKDKYVGTPLDLDDDRLKSQSDWLKKHDVTIVKIDSAERHEAEDVYVRRFDNYVRRFCMRRSKTAQDIKWTLNPHTLVFVSVSSLSMGFLAFEPPLLGLRWVYMSPVSQFFIFEQQ